MSKTYSTREIVDLVGVPESRLRNWLRGKRLPYPRRHGSGDLIWGEADLRRVNRLVDEMRREQTANAAV